MSFIYAISGILKAIKTERNLRFHIVIANLICIFAYFYGLNRTQWAILLLTAFLVISLELINTAVEKAVDTATNEILPLAKFAKDVSAGAVLVMAVGAVLVGICLFGDCGRICDTLTLIFTDMWNLAWCLAVGIADILFLYLLREKR